MFQTPFVTESAALVQVVGVCYGSLNPMLRATYVRIARGPNQYTVSLDIVERLVVIQDNATVLTDVHPRV